jgi:hypothetical protein
MTTVYETLMWSLTKFINLSVYNRKQKWSSW